MRRHVTLVCSKAEIDQAEVFRMKWAEALGVKLDVSSLSRVQGKGGEAETAETVTVGSAKPKVIIVLIGLGTADDATLMAAVDESLKHGDVVVGVRTSQDAKGPGILYNAGCEVLEWDNSEIPEACERAFLAIHRAPAIVEAAKNTGATQEDECARAPTAVVESDDVPVPT